MLPCEGTGFAHTSQGFFMTGRDAGNEEFLRPHYGVIPPMGC